MRTMAVVVGGVLDENAREVSFVSDRDAVGALAADSADPTFGMRVHPRRLRWGADDLDVGCGEYGVERAVNFVSRSRSRYRSRSVWWSRFMNRFRACWVAGADGVRGDVYLAGGYLEEEEDVDPFQEHVSTQHPAGPPTAPDTDVATWTWGRTRYCSSPGRCSSTPTTCPSAGQIVAGQVHLSYHQHDATGTPPLGRRQVGFALRLPPSPPLDDGGALGGVDVDRPVGCYVDGQPVPRRERLTLHTG